MLHPVPYPTGRTNSPTTTFGASVRCPKHVTTSSNRELSKTKFEHLGLRTLFELPSARFEKCAPHLNLKPCLGQATHSSPLLIVQSKEKIKS